MKVAGLTGRDLDYWVARALGFKTVPRPGFWKCQGTKALQHGEGDEAEIWCVECQLPSYSEHWDTNGYQAIERRRIHLMPHVEREGTGDWWYAEATASPILNANGDFVSYPTADGPSMLLAGLRCIVTASFGEDVPHE